MKAAAVVVSLLLLGQETHQRTWEDRGFAADTSEIKDLVLHEGARAATLKSDLAKLIYHSDPGRFDVVGDMILLDGRLLASCSFEFRAAGMPYSHSSQVLEYDEIADEWKVLKEIPSSLILNLRVLNGKLTIPEFHPAAADQIHLYDGKEWSRLGPLPRPMLHGMDLCSYGGKLYWSGSWRGSMFDETQKDEDWSAGYGKVYESADGGQAWKEIYSDPLNGRMQDMVVFQGKLYCNRRSHTLMSYDGREWKEIPVNLPTKKGEHALLGNALLYVFKEHLLAVSAELYYRFDGDKWTAYAPGFLRLFPDGETLYGLRDDGHVYASTDGKTWRKVTENGGVPKEEYERQSDMGRTLRRGSVALHHGKLLVGTGATGKIYESPFTAKGSLVGPAHKIDGSGTLEWAALVPEGSKLVMSVRTAKSARELKNAPWKGEHGSSPAKIDVPRNHPWFQYRASFESTDGGRHAPALKSVAWTVK